MAEQAERPDDRGRRERQPEAAIVAASRELGEPPVDVTPRHVGVRRGVGVDPERREERVGVELEPAEQLRQWPEQGDRDAVGGEHGQTLVENTARWPCCFA